MDYDVAAVWYTLGGVAIVLTAVLLYFLLKRWCYKGQVRLEHASSSLPSVRSSITTSQNSHRQQTEWSPSSDSGRYEESRRSGSRSASRERPLRFWELTPRTSTASAQVTIENERQAPIVAARGQPYRATTGLPGIHGRQTSRGKENIPATKPFSISNTIAQKTYPARPTSHFSDEESSEEDSLASYLKSKISQVDAAAVATKVTTATSPLYIDDPAWITFKRRHVITYAQHPDHPYWGSEMWNDFLQERGLSQRAVNTIISCESENEILEDFNPLDKVAQFAGKNSEGPVYKSKNIHYIYHMIEVEPDYGWFQVYKETGKHFVAAVRLMNDRGDNFAVWAPVHFHARYLTGMFDVRGSRLIK